MSDTNKNVVITVAGRQKLVKARAGAITLPKIVGMAFGDGGVNAGGQVITPSTNQTALNHQLLRKPVDGYTFPTATSCRYTCTLDESELAGEAISELGLYDQDGDIVCIKNMTAKGKDDDIEMAFEVDDIF